MLVVSKIISKFAKEIIVVSKKLSMQLGQNAECHVIPCGIDMKIFFPMDKCWARQILGLPKDKKLILFGGDPDRWEKRYF